MKHATVLKTLFKKGIVVHFVTTLMMMTLLKNYIDNGHMLETTTYKTN